MLRQIGQGCFRCRRSIGLQRSIHHVASSGHHPAEEPSNSPASTAPAKDPRWLLLNSIGRRTDDDSGSLLADTKTAADSHTYAGDHLRVSLQRAAPPASSFLYYGWPGSEPDDEEDRRRESLGVFAAHGNAVLFDVGPSGSYSCQRDRFVYRAGGGGPPTLSLLPDRDFLTRTEQDVAAYRLDPIFPMVYAGNTCLLRRGDGDGDGELLVVQLEIKYERGARRYMAEFCVLRVGDDEWELKDLVPIAVDEGGDGPQLRSASDIVFPVGDRFLCWADYERGFYLCDMADTASPKVRYVHLPAEARPRSKHYHDDLPLMKHSRTMGAAGDGAVRFVSVDPHCCCGGPGRSTCATSRFAFTVTAWTMDVAADDGEALAWVKDAVLDCEELWALPGYQALGLPRALVRCPVVSLDDPNLVCLLVCNREFVSSYEDQKVWMIQVDMRSKAMVSAVEFTGDPWKAYHHFPAQLQC